MRGVRTLLVLGATSAIAQALARRYSEAGGRCVLAARNVGRLADIAADLRARGAPEVVIEICDFQRDDPDEGTARLLAHSPAPDLVLLAWGALGDQCEAEMKVGVARETLESNFVSPALWLLALTRALPREHASTLVVLGSVAGDRGRQSNFVYGAAKAGLAALCEGLQHRLHGTSLRVLLVKPGPVDTPMTAHMPRGGMPFASPDAVAAHIVRAATKGRSELYTPWFWRWIMLLIRFTPRAILHRTKL
ncbi:SDR family NAD(P)-dependent oxidoreductase [Muricoccus radiodurans]|uniref:SDR family NAD(P)-dependent oxidoreductase n=1 Tax=Muricoccus radiodurans TaxID=2231721 RepID=UPI003CEF8585